MFSIYLSIYERLYGKAGKNVSELFRRKDVLSQNLTGDQKKKKQEKSEKREFEGAASGFC